MKTNNKKALYLDDVKVPLKDIPGYEPWHIAKNFTEFEIYIRIKGVPDYISFGHDLAMEHTNDFASYQMQGIPAINYGDFKEKTGLDCLKWLCDYITEQRELGNDITLKAVGVHTDNPLGAINILSMANGFKKHMGWEPDAFEIKHEFKIDENESKSKETA
jgi:hypothetical protein